MTTNSSLRYQRQMGTITEDEQRRLSLAHVAVVGCGGLGGYVIEMLGRVGVGRLTVADSDCFDESNLNRQILATVETVGKSKAEEAVERMSVVNPQVIVKALEETITADNSTRLLQGCDLLIDAVDNIKTRFILQEAAQEMGIPMVHGAIAGWYGQVSVIFPGDPGCRAIYPEPDSTGLEAELGNPAFTPAVVAGIQAAEAVKVLLRKEGVLQNRLLHIDLLHSMFEVLSLSKPT